jgi:uncharacterized caspase-like protein
MGKRIALVIGTCTYEDPQFAALGAPVHDVRGLAGTLRDPSVGGFDEVHELVDRTARDVQMEISNVFADRERDDLVVVYLSGHGYKDRGKLFFVCKDTRRNRLNATGVPSDYLKQEMESSAARRQVLILDCCHSGAFSAGMKGGGTVGDKAGAIDELGGDESGKIVLTASDAIQYAYEGDAVTGQAQNSVFTKHLLEGLRTGAADMDGDGSISVDELFDYVRQKVRQERPDQRPQRSATAESGDVFIARSPYVKPAELAKELVEATRSKDRLTVTGSIDDLRRLLLDPDPRMVAAARQRLQEMLLEDNFRSVLDKVQEALDAVQVNVVVKPKAARVRTGPAGPGSAGFEPPAVAPESSPWSAPPPSTPYTPHDPGSMLREPVRVSPPTAPVRSTSPTDCGPGKPALAALIVGGGMGLAMMVSGGVLIASLRAGQFESASIVSQIFLGVVLGPVMAFGHPIGWSGPHKGKRVAVGIAWGLLTIAGAIASAWTSRDQPGMTTGRAWAVFGIWAGAIVVGIGIPSALGEAMGFSAAWIALSMVIGAAAGAVGAFAHASILATSRRLAQR